MSDLEKHYHTLELTPGADWSAVTRAYRDLIKVWHPDRFLHDEELRLRAEAKSKELNEAIRQLRKHYRKISLFRRASSPHAEHSTSGAWSASGPGSSAQPRPGHRAEPRHDTPPSGREAGDFPPSGSQPVYAALKRRNHSLQRMRFCAGFFTVTTAAVLVASVGLPQDIVSLGRNAQSASTTGYRRITAPGVEPPAAPEFRPREEVWAPRGRPRLVDTAANCNVKAAMSLLQSGADVNESDDNGDTALAWAARTSCIPVAKLLLSRGASTNSVARNGYTPKDWAKWTRNPKMMAMVSGYSPRF